MATPATGNRPTPERIFNALNAHQQTAALRTAIELDIFSAIGSGANTAAAIAAKIGASEKGVRVLCDFLTIHEFLAKDQGKYALTQESALFLDRKSPACLASMAGFLGLEDHHKFFAALTAAVRKGGAIGHLIVASGISRVFPTARTSCGSKAGFRSGVCPRGDEIGKFRCSRGLFQSGGLAELGSWRPTAIIRHKNAGSNSTACAGWPHCW